MNDALLVRNPQIPCSLNEAPSAEEVCLGWAVAHHWKPFAQYPMQRILERRRATWADLDVVPCLPAAAFQPINRPTTA